MNFLTFSSLRYFVHPDPKMRQPFLQSNTTLTDTKDDDTDEKPKA